jgi:RHS repeat-associated protein
MHRHTPTLAAIDPRGSLVRDVAYHRRSDQDAPQPRVNHHLHDAPNRLVQSRDPRFFARQGGAVSQFANQTTVFSLTSRVLLSDNVDAGWRLALAGAAGQSLEDWDQKLNHLCSTYDAMMRPVSGEEATPGQQRRTACFSYAGADVESALHNRCGQLIRADDSAGTLHFTQFSLLGACLEQSRRFLEQVEVPDWPESEAGRDALLEPQSATTRLRYNAVGELTGLVDAMGNQHIQRQTVAGAVSEVCFKRAASGDEVPLVTGIRYNVFAEIEQQTAGNGLIIHATFEPETGSLQTLQTHLAGEALLQDLTYAYDPVGNLLRISDGAQPAVFFRQQRVAATSTYRYDTLGQLIEATGRQRVNVAYGPALPAFVSPPDPSQMEQYRQAFDYDAGGNLHTLSHHAGSGDRTERMAISMSSNRSLPWGETGQAPSDDEIEAAHDACGNLRTLQRGQKLAWDVHNRLCEATQVVRHAGPGDVERYVYDGEGQRLRKVRTTATATLNRIHETRYLPGLEIRSDAEDVLHVISLQAGRCTVQLLHWDNGRPEGIAQDQWRYSLTDHLGSGTLEFDQNAALVSQEHYYPYGGTAWWAGRDGVEAGYKTRRYCHRERDATGLYYFGQRYYLPWRQRWLNADPGGLVDGLNLYRMVGGDPVGYVDLDGLAKVRATLRQRTQAALAGIARGSVAAIAGDGAKRLAKRVLQGALGQSVRYPLAMVSGVATAYVGARTAAAVLASHGQHGTLAKLTVAGVAVVGFGVGAAAGFTTSDPLGMIHEAAENLGLSVVGSAISGIGPSLPAKIKTRGALAVNTLANVSGNVVTGIVPRIMPSVVPPMLQTVAGVVMENTVGLMVRAVGGVGSRYKESKHSTFRLPTARDVMGAGVSFAQNAASGLVYQMANAEIDKGLTQVIGPDEGGSLWRGGLGTMKLANEVGAIGEHIYKTPKLDLAGPSRKPLVQPVIVV